jgi:hypothetical protein
MKANKCGTCKHGKSMCGTIKGVFQSWDRYYVVCNILGNNEITPILRDFISTCGCASWEQSE